MNTKAQSTIEFTFAMVIVALLIYGLIKTFRWVGMDYAQSSYIQEQANVFVHGSGCDPTDPRAISPCFSLNAESDGRKPRLSAFTRKF
jgi:hypothetical protein